LLLRDALGRCVKRTLNGVSNYYVFDGEHWVVEYDASNVITSNASYGRGMDELIARYNGSAPSGKQSQWFFPDRNGNINVVTDGVNGVLESYRYDAFGLPTIYGPTGTVLGATAISNRFLFTGREWRLLFGFYEYRARVYNATIGRFMSEDPKGFDASDYNLYRYCHNDPWDLSDPVGLEEEYSDARVTAYGFGKDNAYLGHRDGGDVVAHGISISRREQVGKDENGEPSYVYHATLGEGTFAHPSSMATHPDANIDFGSRVYVKGIGWFIVEDRCAHDMPKNTFDMWTGRSDSKQRASLTRPGM
jgi:RHS repeat-associated protein